MLIGMGVRTAVWSAALAGLLFGAAGTLRWPAAWVFVAGGFAVALAMGAVLARRDPALLAERMAPPLQRGQAAWDRLFMVGAMLAYLAWLVLIALDAARYRWSVVPPALQGGGGVALLAGFWLVQRAFRANSFSAPVVKIQAA